MARHDGGEIIAYRRKVVESEWRRGSESNRRIKVLQTSPLPLGYRALKSTLAPDPQKVYRSVCESTQGKCPRNEGWASESMERETGFEPATSTLARSHSTTELLPLSSEHYKRVATARQTFEGNRLPLEPCVSSVSEGVPHPLMLTTVPGLGLCWPGRMFFMVSRPLRVLLGSNDLAITHVNDLVSVFSGFRIVRDH